MEIQELVRVPGVPESDVDPGVASRLGPNLAPAPWKCSAQSVLWFGRGGRAATKALAPELARSHKGLSVVGGMVHYTDTPVGSYGEVFGAVAVRRGHRIVGTVPFMSVDSETSLVGGRSNWSLPKTLSSFEGAPVPGATMVARGSSWTVHATARPLGPAIPLIPLTISLAQQWPDGVVRHAPMRAWGRARPALVTVEVDAGKSLSGWLRPGRHAGLILESMEFTLGVSSAPRNGV
ncbi:acetoacetate decarboxylase family protein [Hoyosella sp. YIM 151337]|uniref:acetoacetate decarboxylase family protein n=1 Tax=Hoyosella sp. YIM 151337 TaxID=2992742 RepID=UPI0022360600|nr:acetoacetate decarboxylase family protein [Hoyosella sp. YIM 151337]MCW4354887.1 acetoacetate decarboxylase family protein [Hoyosella sp. YIM 151337]